MKSAAVLCMMLFISDSVGASSFCNTAQDPVPCAYFEEGRVATRPEGFSEIWARAMFTLKPVNILGPQLELSGSALSRTDFRSDVLPLQGFQLRVANYEPNCMAWDEYYASQNRPVDLAELTFELRGEAHKAQLECTFSRVYGAGYKFTPGLRQLRCESREAPIRDPHRPSDWSYSLTFLLPSQNRTTENPCLGRVYPPPKPIDI